MLIPTWKKRVLTTTTPQLTVSERVNAVAKLLEKHVANGVINVEQLIKIHNLATNPEKLKSALEWL